MSLPGNQVPVEIVPRTRAKIELKYVVGANIVNTLEEVLQRVQDLLNEALRTTIVETELWIDNHVPNRSGDLIKSLKKFLNRSVPPVSTIGELRGIRLILGVGADITYAKYVDEMTIANVRHFSTWFEHSGVLAYSKGRPVFLNDFRAVGHFFDKMVDFSKERLQINVDKARYKFRSE